MTATIPRASHDVGSLTLFMTAVLLAFIVQVPEIIVAGTALCGVYAYAGRSDTALNLDELLALALVSVLFLPAFAKPYHGASPIFYFAATLAAFAAARVVSRKPAPVLLAAFQRIYWASIAAVVVILYTYWGYPEPFGMVIEGSSTNGIPAYLIVVQIGLSLCHYLVHRRLPLASPVFTFAVAFFGNGRGSLVVAALMIAATILLNLLPAGPARPRRWVYPALFVVAIVVAVEWGEELFDLVSTYTKLSVGLVDTNRLEILEQYFDKIDAFTFLFGADYAGTVIQTEYRNNPHISYIRTHSFFGLPLTVLAMASPVIVLFARTKTPAARAVFFTFIGLAALRAYSEPLFFPTLLDFFYFSYFLIFFNHAAGRARNPAAGRPRSHAPA